MRTVSFVLFACSSLFVTEFVSFVHSSINSIPDDELIYENVLQQSINDYLTAMNEGSRNDSSSSQWIENATDTKLTVSVNEARGWVIMKAEDPILRWARDLFVTEVYVNGNLGSSVIAVDLDLHVSEFTIETDTFTLKGNWQGDDLDETSEFSMTYNNITVPIRMTIELGEIEGKPQLRVISVDMEGHDHTKSEQPDALHLFTTFPREFNFRGICDSLKLQVKIKILQQKMQKFVDGLFDNCSWPVLMFGRF